MTSDTLVPAHWRLRRLTASSSTPLVVSATLVLAGLAVLYFAARPPLIPSDDAAIYVTSAQALAEGKGYRLIGYPGAPPNTFYPPAYSALLSLPMRLQPEFPANLSLLQLLSVLIYCCFLAVGALVLRRCYGASAADTVLALLLTATTPLALYHSTAIMSDTLYGVLALGAILLVRTGWQRPSQRGLLQLLIGGLLAVAAYYTRLIGLALLIALALDGLRRVRASPWRAGIMCLPLALAVPWVLWSTLNGGSGYLRHWSHGTAGWSVGVHDAESLIIVVIGNLLLGADVLTVVTPSLVDKTVLPGVTPNQPLAWVAAGGLLVAIVWQSWSGWRRSRELVDLYLLLYLAVTVLWPYRVLGRLLWPVAPLLAWHLVHCLRQGWRAIARTLRWRCSRAPDLIAVGLLAANAVWLADLSARTARGEWVANPTDREALLAMYETAAYLRDVVPSSVALGSNHVNAAAWWYLYTGRHGFDAVVRADGAGPFYAPADRQGDPAQIGYFVFQRNNGSTPTGGDQDWPLLQRALVARGAPLEPLACASSGEVCVFDWPSPHR